MGGKSDGTYPANCGCQVRKSLMEMENDDNRYRTINSQLRDTNYLLDALEYCFTSPAADGREIPTSRLINFDLEFLKGVLHPRPLL